MTRFVDKHRHVFLALLSIIVLFSILSEDGPHNEGRPYGKPHISTDYGSYTLKSVYQVCDDGQRIYILPNSQDGFIQVYDLDGNYLSTLMFYNHNNGGFAITIENSTLYVFDKLNNVYVFKEGIFSAFFTREEAETQLDNIDRFRLSNSNEYTFRAGSIWRNTSEGAQCVVKGPAEYVYYIQQYGPSILLLIMCIYVMIILLHNQNRKIGQA